MFKLKNFNHSEVIKVSEIINELVMNFVRTVCSTRNNNEKLTVISQTCN